MRGSTRVWRVVVGAAVSLGVAAAALLGAAPAQALSGSDFQAGYIISDARFFANNAMSSAQVQAFLVAQGAGCHASSSAACIKDYRMTTTSRAATPNGCAAYAGAANELASQIIWKVAQACRINPQVLLVTLQKEEGLIQAKSPTSAVYRKAMGYACPDTSVCDSKYYGFYNQVYSAAWQFRQYTYQPNRTYKIGGVAIRYNPKTSCGSKAVTIFNQGTANLYNYTPYQPNASALAHLGSTGDSCSSYGNLNFWRYYNGWFGSSTGPVNPLGAIDKVSPAANAVRLSGWAVDPDSTSSIYVDAYVDGAVSRILASNIRNDVAASLGKGAAHGYDVTLPVTKAGAHTVCIYGINVGPGKNTLLKPCTTVTTTVGPPTGGFDSATAGIAGVSVYGWALDPDAQEATDVKITVDKTSYVRTADQTRSDIGARYPGYGADHGFLETVPATAGVHTVCVTAVNTGPGTDKALGCRTTTVLAGSPQGRLDSVVATPGTITATGWTFDPDTADSIPVRLTLDGVPTTITASVARADVAKVYPAYGTPHGYTQSFPATPGTHTVCAYGVESAGTGTTRLLSCKSVVALSGHPVGRLDTLVAGPGVVTARGWTHDPDTAAPISVRLTVDGVPTTVLANASRPDVAKVYPLYGAAHGYSQTLALPAGTHTVCAYGIESDGSGAATLLACKKVTALTGSPAGRLDSINVVDGILTAVGWAHDPDSATPISVKLVVDGVATTVAANVSRPDVATVYPGWGDDQGYSQTFPVSAGTHQVCATGVNVGGGADTLFSCKTVTVLPAPPPAAPAADISAMP